MKSTIKKIVGIALAAVLTMSFALEPSHAAVQKVEAPEAVTLYAAIPTGGWTSTSFSVSVPEYKKVTSVKSSNKAVAKLWYIERYKSTYAYDEDYYSEDGKKSNNNKYDSENFSNRIGVRLYKAGTSTISYKYGGETYKTKITAKKYVNPIKTLTISGVSSGNNIASKVKNTNYVYGLKLSKDTANAKLNVTATDGWKLSNVSFYTEKKVKSGDYYYYNNVETTSKSVNSGTSSATLNLGKIKKANTYEVYLSFFNTKDGGYESVNYYINR